MNLLSVLGLMIDVDLSIVINFDCHFKDDNNDCGDQLSYLNVSNL